MQWVCVLALHLYDSRFAMPAQPTPRRVSKAHAVGKSTARILAYLSLALQLQGAHPCIRHSLTPAACCNVNKSDLNMYWCAERVGFAIVLEAKHDWTLLGAQVLRKPGHVRHQGDRLLQCELSGLLCRKTLLPQRPVSPKRVTSQVTSPCKNKNLLCAVQ